MAPELTCSHPQSVHPEVPAWTAVEAIALLGEPGTLAPERPAGTLTHTLCTLSRAVTSSLLDFQVDCSVV